MDERTTLGAALERYLIEVTPSKKGYAQEERRIQAWLKHPLAHRSLASVTSTDFAKYRDERLKSGRASSRVWSSSNIMVRLAWAPLRPMRKPNLAMLSWPPSEAGVFLCCWFTVVGWG